MTPERATNLALSIRLWQAHRQSHNGRQGQYIDDEAGDEALAMARECGEEVRVAYLASLSTVPVMSVTILNLDVPKKRKPKSVWRAF